MSESLPERPSLDHLRHQAKTLLRGVREADPGALARCQQHRSAVFGQSAPPTDPSWASRLKLADVQRIVAREYGFHSWAQLKEHVEEIQLMARGRSDRAAVLIGYCLRGELERAERWMARDGELVQSDLGLAAAVGDVAAVRSAILRDTTAIGHPSGPLKAPPLVYACASRFAAPGTSREVGVRQVVEVLLLSGADPNSYWMSPDAGQVRLSALYGACGINGNAALAQMLLQAGADPNDNESLYHSVEHGSAECTELLLRYGAKIAGTNAVHHATGMGNLSALKLLLQHGADVNERIMAQHGMTLLDWAIECHQGTDILETLIERGADLRAVSLDRKTPFRRAAMSGHRVAVDLLGRHGVVESLSAEEAMLSACMMGDTTRLRELMSATPRGGDGWPHAMRDHLFTAAWNGNQAAVEAMLAVGFDVAWGNGRRATALHAAAWKGYADMVDVLLDAGAPLDPRETEFGCTPLEWALHGSCHCQSRLVVEPPGAREGRYARIVTQLLEAGSSRPVDRLVGPCRGGVLEVLEGAGIAPDDGDPP